MVSLFTPRRPYERSRSYRDKSTFSFCTFSFCAHPGIRLQRKSKFNLLLHSTIRVSTVRLPFHRGGGERGSHATSPHTYYCSLPSPTESLHSSAHRDRHKPS